MKTKPILFSTPMVQAILEDRKTQTRRILKIKGCKWFVPNPEEFPTISELEKWGAKPKYNAGDIIWVRESFEYSDDLDEPYLYKQQAEQDFNPEFFSEMKWRPSIHMPKEAARIFLEVTSVRCEHLQAISEEDAIAEGIEPGEIGFKSYNPKNIFEVDALWSFQNLWESINGKGSWKQNPWVWVYEFKKIENPELL